MSLRSRWWQWTVLPVFAVCALCTESVANEGTAADSSLSPREALIRSAVLPGWGQYSNGHPLKAALFGTSTAAFVAATWSKVGDLSDTSDRIRSTRRELQLAPFQTVHGLHQQLGTDLPQAFIQLARCLIRTNRNGPLHENITCVDTRIE